MEFSGIVKPRRRGGWIARGLIVEQRFGQLFETQVGPREFADQSASVTWLADAGQAPWYRPARIATLAATRR